MKYQLIGRMLYLGAFTVLFSNACSGPAYPKCKEDKDCKIKEVCVYGTCQQCRDNSQCAWGSYCNRGRCDRDKTMCKKNGDCSVGEECRANRCISLEKLKPTSSDDSGNAGKSDGGCTLETTYFDYDSDGLAQSTREKLEKSARCIRERGVGAVLVTGYTDPRGTEEYNLALGERRARSVAKYLEAVGVGKAKTRTHSMGEEMSKGTDDSGWVQDRRAELTSE